MDHPDPAPTAPDDTAASLSRWAALIASHPPLTDDEIHTAATVLDRVDLHHHIHPSPGIPPTA